MPEHEKHDFEKALERLAAMDQGHDPFGASDRVRSLVKNKTGDGGGSEAIAKGIEFLSRAIVNQMNRLLNIREGKVLTWAAERDFKVTAEEELLELIEYIAGRYLEQVKSEDLIGRDEKRGQIGLRPKG